jgi:hypothetical protein
MKTGVFTFGDKLPAGKDSDFFVSYQVEGIPGGMLSGPYVDRILAESEVEDIQSYNNVCNVKLITRVELLRTEFFPYTGDA